MKRIIFGRLSSLSRELVDTKQKLSLVYMTQYILLTCSHPGHMAKVGQEAAEEVYG